MSYRAAGAVPGAPRLLVSSVLGRLPLGTSAISILLFLHGLDGSFAPAAIVIAAFTLAGGLGAPPLGGLVDRFGAVRILLPCAVGHAAGLIALVLIARGGAGVAGLACLAAAAGALEPPISSVARAVWPTVAPDPETREAGYALDAVAQELIWTLGPLLVAASIAVAGGAAPIYLSAALTLGGTLLFAASPLVRDFHPGPPATARPSVLLAPGMPRVIACIALMGFGLGASEVGVPAIAVGIGHPQLGALLLALLSVGSICGGLWYGVRSRPLSLERRHGVLLLTLAAFTLPMALFATSVATALPLALLAGAAWSPVLSCQYALVAELAPPGGATRAFTWTIAVVVVGLAFGSALAGALVDSLGSHSGLAEAAVGYLAAGLLALAPRPSRAAIGRPRDESGWRAPGRRSGSARRRRERLRRAPRRES